VTGKRRGMGLAVLLWTGTVSAQVDVYRSVNENGVVQFSDARQSDTDEHFQLTTVSPAPGMIDAQGRLMDQQLELIALLEQSRRDRAQENFERRRQSVELARARLALEQERNAAYAQNTRDYGYAYPVGYSYKYKRRHGNRQEYGHGGGNRPGHLPARPGHGGRAGHGGRLGYGGREGGGRGTHGGSKTLIKPFITRS
jgi:hypothetical protein